MLDIYFDIVSTPLGNMHAALTEKGLAMLEFDIDERISIHRNKFAENYRETSTPPTDLLNHLKEQLTLYFDGNLTQFDIPLDLIGTEFQCRVWNALQEIPYGKTRSYLELAESIANKNGVRAVAQANGQNRIPIIVPCHRVLGSSGSLTGYSGGMWRKEILLNKEQGQHRLTF